VTRLLRLTPLLLGVALVLLLGRRFGVHGIAGAFAHLSPAYLVSYLALTVAVVLGYAWRWRLVSRSLGLGLPLGRLAVARLAGDAVGNLVPSARLAGDPVRVAIACAGGAEATAATAGVALDRVLETVSSILCALVYVSVFSLTHTLGPGVGSARLLAGALLAGLAALAVPLVMLRRGARPLQPLYSLLGGRRPPWLAAVRRTEEHLLRLFRERPSIFAWGVLLSLAVESLVVAQYHCLLAAFAVRVDLPTLLLALVGTGMARAVPAPAALGTLEASQVAVLGLAAGDPALGFVAGLVIRLHETLLLVAGLVALAANGLSLSRLLSRGPAVSGEQPGLAPPSRLRLRLRSSVAGRRRES
jgi:uncharacterized membrane protein YbhN (UPF0104 family)